MIPAESLLPTSSLVLGAAAILIAFIVRGFTGFGAALIAIPLLALVLDFKQVVLVVGVLSIINGVSMTLAVRGECDRKEIGPLFGGFLVGMALGVAALLYLPAPVLKRAFGLFVALFAMRLLLVQTEAVGSAGRPGRLGGGVCSGSLGGCSALGRRRSSILHRLQSPQVLRATVIVYFLAGDVARLGTYAAAGAITLPVLWASLWLVPSSFIGTWIGTGLQRRASPAFFRAVVAATSWSPACCSRWEVRGGARGKAARPN